MAGNSKADLPVDLGLIAAPDLKPLTAAKAGGTEENKVPMGCLDELKDQAASENSIPLSPQWLYAKTGDSKVALSTAPGDARSPSFLTQGTLVDSAQRDAWRPEGPHDKKEWRRNVPDVENSRRWHDEERETGLLGRRERRKEGDRENEYRKSDRRSENVSMRDTADSRSLPSSDRWHEVPNRNSGYDSRRDSKWSSRWGPEDKEKDTRLEKRTDGDKDETHVEKQSVIGGSRPLPESDSRDKWKPRHRLETHSSGTAVYRAAPGFGVERGRVEGPVVGFAPGRGRSNSVGNLPFSGSSSTVSLGAVPSILNGSLLGKSSLSADTFRYPRGKILDIYRKNKMLSPFDSTHEGFVEVHQLTESSSIPPLAFVKPNSEEVDVLEDIWKGKVTSSDPQMEKMDKVSVCEIATSDDGKCKDKSRAMSNGKDLGVITSTVSKGDVFSNDPGCLLKNNDGSVEFPDFLNDSKFAALDSTPLDIFTKLPDDSNSLFSASFIQAIPGRDSQHPDSTKRELVHQTSELFYQDPQGQTQGPFLAVDILSWYDQGFFGADLPVRLSDAPEGTDFQSLGDLIPNLSLRPQSTSPVNPDEQTVQLDTTGGNLEATSPATEFSNPLTLTDKQLQSSESDVRIGQQAQPRVSPPEASSHFQMPQVSHPEISGGIAVAERQNFLDISGQDAEEVLYMGRPGNSIQNPSGKLSYDIHDLSRTSNGNQYLQTGHANFTNYKTPTDDDSNPLGLSWSELEGAHHKGPLSSITSGVGNRGHNINPLLGVDASLFRHNNQDSWSGNNRRNTGSNILHDAYEPEINNFNIEDSLLSQKFQMQQHLMSSHQNMQLSGSYSEQLHPLHQQQSMLYRERMLKLQIQRQQHLQQVEEEEQLRQQQQLHHQMQLLQQQHQQQQQQQLLIEQLLHHKFNERNFGVPHVDPLRGENSLEQILYRQHLLHELQQAHHLPLGHDPSLDPLMQAKLGHNRHLEHHNELLDALSHPSHRRMLPLEQQYLLDLQQEHIQSRQFPISSRHQPGMDEERHVGGAWSIDESGQFVRVPTGQHHSRSGRPSQLDFVQPLQRTSSFEQPTHLDRNFLLHDRIQQGNFGLSSLSLERSASTPRPDMDLINAYARLQGMDVQDSYGRSGQMGQLSGNRSQQNWLPNQHPNLHLDVMERNWSEPNGQLQNNLIESQFAQLHLAAEKQKIEMQADLSFEDWSRRSSLVGNNEIPNNGPVDLLRQKLLQSSQALGMVDATLTSSYENRDPSWLFSQHATDDSTIFNVDNTSFGESSMEGSLFARLGQTNQLRSANLNSVGRADSFFESGRRLPFRSSSGASSEHTQFFADNETENYQLAHPMGGIEQSEASVIDHDALRNKGPVRHSSFGVTGGGMNLYNYDMGPDNAYVDLMANDRTSGNCPVPVPEISSSRNDMARARRTLSYSDTDAAPEASFMDMLKGTRKQTPAEAEGSGDPSDAGGSGCKNNKKKGKKGRQIDPSLLGFKVHSNRIMMGEIQRPE